MGNRAVKQPNGLYARFSEMVDDFTHVNCTRETLWEYYGGERDIEHANGKMDRADNEPGRFDEAMKIIEAIHGKDHATETLSECSSPI